MAYITDRLKQNPRSVVIRSSLSSLQWLAWFTVLLGITVVFSFLMMRKGPGTSFLAWLVYLSGIAIILYKPRYGIYLVVCFGLAGDTILSPWFPFVKNFSSRESLLFVDDALIINPLETYLVLIYLSWFIHSVSQRKLQIYRGVLLPPILAFMIFVIFGLGYGVVYTRGNLNIALWEARPLFYLAFMVFLVSNLLEKREHAINLVWAAMIGIFLEGVSGNIYFWFTLQASLAGVNEITEHPAAIHMNTLFVFFLAAWLYKVSPTKRFALGMMLPIVLITYMATQRRAAFIAIAGALIVIAFLLSMENRRVFWTILPVIVPLFAGYMLIFWNSSNALGLPAQAVKGVIAPNRASIADQRSNAYRDIENINLNFTIRQKPFTGIGFGQKFYVIIPLPDISFFQWWQYFR